MFQTVIVYIIGAALLVYLSYKVYRIFAKKEYGSLCGGCPLADECVKARKERSSCGENRRDEGEGGRD